MNTIRIRCLEHVPYETSGIIQYWAEIREHEFSKTLLYKGEELPNTRNFDWLLVMGGPMSVNDESSCPWMTNEKKLIEKAIVEGKTVIGICLGAQMVADVLGARVHTSKAKEIGWHPVTLSPKAVELELFESFPQEFMAFHWHQETFDIPARAINIASSNACSNQGFIFKERIIGLQFHLEMMGNSVLDILEHHKNEVRDGKYVQLDTDIIKGINHTKSSNGIIEELLNRIAERTPKALTPAEKKIKKKA